MQSNSEVALMLLDMNILDSDREGIQGKVAIAQKVIQKIQDEGISVPKNIFEMLATVNIAYSRFPKNDELSQIRFESGIDNIFWSFNAEVRKLLGIQ